MVLKEGKIGFWWIGFVVKIGTIRLGILQMWLHNPEKMAYVLSYFQLKPILAARGTGRDEMACSLDLGLSQTMVKLTPAGLWLPNDFCLTWESVGEIVANELGCYWVAPAGIEKIQFFSQPFQRFYSLMPTAGAPTMLISGIPMHRIKDVDPHQDTLNKIKALGPVTGKVLDTTMGLGYTAIQAAKRAQSVITLELDPTVLEICRRNPWSQLLFDNPKITQIVADAYDWVTEVEEGVFSAVIHDPPTFSLAGDLYSADFYRQLWRVLKARGRLFHYIGDPHSKSGANVTKGVVRRLQAVGFGQVVLKPEAFGLLAVKN